MEANSCSWTLTIRNLVMIYGCELVDYRYEVDYLSKKKMTGIRTSEAKICR